MAPALANAIVPLRDEEHKTTEHMRRKTARALKQRNRMAEVNPLGCVDDNVALVLGRLVTSTPLPRVEAEGIEYIEPDYRSAKQKKREKKLAKKMAKQLAHSEDKAVTEPEPLPEVTKPKVEKAPVVVPPVTQPKQAAATQGKLDDHHRLDQFTGLLKSAGAEKAMMFLRDCFGVKDTQDGCRLSDHSEALMMEYIRTHVSTLQAVSLSIEQRPYGGVNPHFTEYKTRRTESMWQHHNGPVVTKWKGEDYLVSESIEKWENRNGELHLVGVEKVRRIRQIHIGCLQWLEKGDEFDYVRCDLGVGTEHHNFTLQTFTHNTPLMVGDLRVGVQCQTTSVAVPQVSEATRTARKARVIRGKISEHAVAERLAEVTFKDPASVANNVVSIADFAERQAANSDSYLSDVDAQSFDGSAALELPAEGLRLDPKQPDETIIAPAHLQSVRRSRPDTVDRNHQRMLAFRDNTLLRMIPRYVVHNTETVPVTTQVSVQEQHVMAPAMPDTSDTLTLMGEFSAPPVARKKVARNDNVRSMTTATDAAYQTWCNGRESRAAWEKNKRDMAEYAEQRLGESWLTDAKRVGLPLYNGSLTKAERLVRLGNTRLMNTEKTPQELKSLHERDDYSYEAWAFDPDKPKTDLQLWFMRADWEESVHHEFTTMDMAYACVRTNVTGYHNVGDTTSCYNGTLDKVKSTVILPAAGLELSGQGEALVVDVAGHELVADKPLIVTKPDTIDYIKEDSIFSQIMASVPGAMTEIQRALVEAINTGVPVSEVRRLVSQYSLESDGGILVA